MSQKLVLLSLLLVANILLIILVTATPIFGAETDHTKKIVTVSENDDGLKMDLSGTVKSIRLYDEGKDVGGLEIVCDDLVKFTFLYDSNTSTLHVYTVRTNGKKACVPVKK